MEKTVIEVFRETRFQYPNEKAIRFKKEKFWHNLTWENYYNMVSLFAKGMISCGLEDKGFVTILSQNRYEWVTADLASIYAGAVPAGIYPTSSPEQCHYIIDHCKASVVIAENEKQLEKILKIKDKLPCLKFIVLIEGESKEPNVYSWNEVIKIGGSVADKVLEERLEKQKVSDLATLVYTSGTTANPKAVMLSHENLLWTAKALLSSEIDLKREDKTISYLPLSHIAEQITAIHVPISVGSCVSFAESLELLGENLKEIRPTVFIGVPRVWEKIQQKMIEKSAQNSSFKRFVARWAKNVGLKNQKKLERGQPTGFLFKLADKIVYKKVREALGLDRCRLQITTAAPISRGTLKFFLSLNIPLSEIYGMSESSGPTTLSLPGDFRVGSSGRTLKGTQIKLADDGEILIKGKHVFMGYMHNQAETDHVLKKGWLHTGDIGEFDKEGYLLITGRKKNILITAGGENIAPEMLEGKLSSIPGLEMAVVVGDQKKYLSALLTLSPSAIDICQEIGSQAKTIEEVRGCELFKAYLDEKLEELNKSVARVQTIKKYTVLNSSFSEESGELTPTLKIKRNIVCLNHNKLIESLYQ